MKKNYIVKAFWDDEAHVWCASSENFVGLATWGKTIPQLITKIKVMIPELLEANKSLGKRRGKNIPITLITENELSHRAVYA